MDSTSQHIKEIISRFLEGAASEEDIVLLKKWLEEDAANRVYFDEVNNAYQASITLKRYSRRKIDDDWNKVSEKINLESGQGRVRRYYFMQPAFIKMAASICLVIGSSILLLTYFFHGFGANNRTIVVNAQQGNRRVVLPDGSLVWLNANSIIEYPHTFGNSSREVNLTGEAFFEVRKGSKPFIVKTEIIQIHVKGTKFNVQAYQDDLSVKTTLEEGKVELHIKGEKSFLVMHPGDQIIVNSSLDKVTRTKVDPSNYSAWKEEQLHFENAPLREIISKLENKYRVQIVATDAVDTHERFSMTIEQESIDEVLDLIQLASRLKARKEGNKILLYQ